MLHQGLVPDIRHQLMRHDMLLRSAQRRYDDALAIASRKPFDNEAQNELLLASRWLRELQADDDA